MPLQQGGSLDFLNMDLCCEDCNRYKGALGEAAFIALKAFVDSLARTGYLADAMELEKRIKISGAVNSMRIKIAKLGEKKAAASPVAVEEPF